MKEDRHNRLVAAITINAVLLIAVLAAILIYQLVNIGLLTARRNKMKSELETYNQKIESTDRSLEYYKSKDYLLDKSYEYGFVYKDAK